MELSRDDLRLILRGLDRLYMQGPTCDDRAILGLMDRIAGEAERRDREVEVRESLRRQGYGPLPRGTAAALRAEWEVRQGSADGARSARTPGP